MIFRTLDPESFKTDTSVWHLVKGDADETVASGSDTGSGRRSGIPDGNKSPILVRQENIMNRQTPVPLEKADSFHDRSPSTELPNTDFIQDYDTGHHGDAISSELVDRDEDPALEKSGSHSPVSKPVKSDADETVVSGSNAGSGRRSGTPDGNKSPLLVRQVNIMDRQTPVPLEKADSFHDQSPSTELPNTDFKQDYDTGHYVNAISSKLVDRDEDPASEKSGSHSPVSNPVKGDADETVVSGSNADSGKTSGIPHGNKSPLLVRQVNIMDRQTPISAITDSSHDQSPLAELSDTDFIQDYDTGHHGDAVSSELVDRDEDPALEKSRSHSPVSNPVKGDADWTVVSGSDTRFGRRYRIVDGNKSPPSDRQGNVMDHQTPSALEKADSFHDQSASVELHNTDVKQDYNVRHHDDGLQVSKYKKSEENEFDVGSLDIDVFDITLLEKRLDVIENEFYRKQMDLWEPASIQQLTNLIKSLSRDKPSVDHAWIIFYWIGNNIKYDVKSYISNNYPKQSAEAVFNSRKGVCAGYGNLYQKLADKTGLRCETVTGYAKEYPFDLRNAKNANTDHVWNVVEIDNYWYLIEATWAAGYLDESKRFKKKFDAYYFLPRPNEMIYHHLPMQDKWQLLDRPITRENFLSRPRTYPEFFDLRLKVVYPERPTSTVSLINGKSYTKIVLKVPNADVEVIAHLKQNGNVVEGGDRVILDNDVYRCFFAPQSRGLHKIVIYAKRKSEERYSSVVEFDFDVSKKLEKPISYPKTWASYFHFGLEVISPNDIYSIRLKESEIQTEILIRVPDDIELTGSLKDHDGKKVPGGDNCYYDNQKQLWRCQFAPSKNGIHEIKIFARKKFDSGTYSCALAFELIATHLTKTISFPRKWQCFYDYQMEIVVPKNSHSGIWPLHGPYCEILMRAPDNIHLLSTIQYKNKEIEDGSIVQYDSDKKLFQCLFAPQNVGHHKLMIYAMLNNDTKQNYSSAVEFALNVTELKCPITFPKIDPQFQRDKCRIFEPLNGVLKKDTNVFFHYLIPNAATIRVTADEKWKTVDSYENNILKHQLKLTNEQQVTIYRQQKNEENFDELVRYTVK
ncbi:unnamed protein product [Didymodactylos carnosus]|nr:unnamed protein product [Didymodactylos carnosus]CAF3807278.1 unnamed protein product [Didymodactylos carnosus]